MLSHTNIMAKWDYVGVGPRIAITYIVMVAHYICNVCITYIHVLGRKYHYEQLPLPYSGWRSDQTHVSTSPNIMEAILSRKRCHFLFRRMLIPLFFRFSQVNFATLPLFWVLQTIKTWMKRCLMTISSEWRSCRWNHVLTWYWCHFVSWKIQTLR